MAVLFLCRNHSCRDTDVFLTNRTVFEEALTKSCSSFSFEMVLELKTFFITPSSTTEFHHRVPQIEWTSVICVRDFCLPRKTPSSKRVGKSAVISNTLLRASSRWIEIWLILAQEAVWISSFSFDSALRSFFAVQRANQPSGERGSEQLQSRLWNGSLLSGGNSALQVHATTRRYQWDWTFLRYFVPRR